MTMRQRCLVAEQPAADRHLLIDRQVAAGDRSRLDRLACRPLHVRWRHQHQIGAIELGLGGVGQFHELAHCHPATKGQHRDVAFQAAQPIDALQLPLVRQAVGADTLDLDLGERGARQHAAPQRAECPGYLHKYRLIGKLRPGRSISSLSRFFPKILQ
ncbi:hypothetical protein CIT31_29730 [Mesorhizobium wenxiniae]|uniref:Uncharacterized protein n=1 Tax=Mesorhizobium wenxiniae TaxID=2014805 RepID=A0A271K8Q0_9HYPH|nr:hypothetical protein CIT31_29730 [Mesorhizobium wenxiniae]